MGATAILKVKEVLFDGMKVRLATGETVWIERSRIDDYLPGDTIVVPEWYKKQVMDKAHRHDEEDE